MMTLTRLLGIGLALGNNSPHHSPQLVIRARFIGSDLERFYAELEHVEVKGNGVLIGMYGNGATPDEAMENYLKKITGQTLVIHASDAERRRELFVL
jgi:hypothetical protein